MVVTAQEFDAAFTIKGQVEGDYKEYIYLRTLGKDNIKDSCLVVDNKFTFTGKLANVAQATLALKPTSTIASFFMDNNSIEMTVAATSFLNGNETINDIEIKSLKGSKVQELLTDVDEYQKTIQKSDLPKDEKNKKIYKKYYELFTSNSNYSVLDFLMQKSKKSGLLSVEQMNQLSSIVSNGKKMEVVKDSLTIKNKVKLSEKLAVGKKLESFSLPNQFDKNITISDFNGKISVMEEKVELKLSKSYKSSDFSLLLNDVKDCLENENEFIQEIKHNQQKMLSQKIDLSNFMIWLFENSPISFDICKKDKNYASKFK